MRLTSSDLHQLEARKREREMRMPPRLTPGERFAVLDQIVAVTGFTPADIERRMGVGKGNAHRWVRHVSEVPGHWEGRLIELHRQVMPKEAAA